MPIISRSEGKRKLLQSRLPALATAEDMEAFGFDPVEDALLLRASARVRRYVRQQISAGESVVKVFGPDYRLPQRPVRDIEYVRTLDGNDIPYELVAGGYLRICSERTVEVSYSHGFEQIPDDVVELVCGIASRLSKTPDSVAGGAQTEQAGGESVTWGSDAFGGTTGLTRAERAELDRLFPRLPRTVHVV